MLLEGDPSYTVRAWEGEQRAHVRYPGAAVLRRHSSCSPALFHLFDCLLNRPETLALELPGMLVHFYF
jgi:hypothetical protein